MARRVANSLERAADRRARFRRGFAFGFFAISYTFGFLGWLLALITGHVSLLDGGPLAIIAIPLGVAVACYAAAIIIGEMNKQEQLERLWLGLTSLLMVGMSLPLILAGAILYLLVLIPG